MSTSSETTPRRRDATRERLLDATRVLLVREGLGGVSVERLCEEAGYSRGAFYSNFASKDELVLALVHREKTAMLRTLHEAADPEGFRGLEPEEAAAAVLERFLVLQPPDRDWFLLHLELQLRGLRHDVGGDEFVGWWREIMTGIGEVVEAALATMGLRLTIATRDAALILMGTWDAIVLQSLAEDEPVDVSILRETLPRMLVALTEPA